MITRIISLKTGALKMWRVFEPYKRISAFFEVRVAVHYWYNNINSQLDAKIAIFYDIYDHLNMFRAIISSNLRSTRLCLQLVV